MSFQNNFGKILFLLALLPPMILVSYIFKLLVESGLSIENPLIGQFNPKQDQKILSQFLFYRNLSYLLYPVFGLLVLGLIIFIRKKIDVNEVIMIVLSIFFGYILITFSYFIAYVLASFIH